eukprot:6969604-Prymnesium_polylepis.1
MQHVDEPNFDDRPDRREQEHHEQPTWAPLEGEKNGDRDGSERRVQRQPIVCTTTSRTSLRQDAAQFVTSHKSGHGEERYRPARSLARPAAPAPIKHRVCDAEDHASAAKGDRNPPARLKHRLLAEAEDPGRTGNRVAGVVQHIMRTVTAIAQWAEQCGGAPHDATLRPPDGCWHRGRWVRRRRAGKCGTPICCVQPGCWAWRRPKGGVGRHHQEERQLQLQLHDFLLRSGLKDALRERT